MDSYLIFPVFGICISCSYIVLSGACLRSSLSRYAEINSCLLQRNYRFFFMFVSTTTILCIYVFSFCWIYIKRIMDAEDTSIWKAMIKTPASMVLIIYTFIAVWFVGGLTAFHLYLISTNQVTHSFTLIFLC